MAGIKENLDKEEENYYALTKKVFRFLAPFYDIISYPLHGIRGKVVDFADARHGSKILDISTGTGKQAFAFAKRGYNVVGIDLSEAMLKIAKKKNKYKNVKFRVADATSLPFANNSFDVSCVSFALHDMPLTIREKAVREMARVTKPKGIMLVVDYDLPKNKVGRFLVYRLVRLYEHYYPEFIKSDLEALLRKSGIEIKRKVSVLFGCGRILKGVKRMR